jgi:dTDP-4-amino-4,6-dideoxygalactose transaminase
MPEWKVPLGRLEFGEEEIEAVAAVYRSGWLSMGPRTEELERRFAEHTGARHAVAVTNGTAALHLICIAAGIGPGDEVIVPSLTFVATVNAVRYVGATPVFADVNGVARPWLAPAAVSGKISDQTAAIINMAYGGHPGETAALAELAADRGIVLLEDAAHGLGASVEGRRLGTFGLAGAFSFFSNKNLPVGEGGMVVTDDDDFAERTRLLRSHAMTAVSWDRRRGRARGYDVLDLGFNYRIDEPRAALATSRLARLDRDNSLRAERAAAYREALDAIAGVEPTAAAAGDSISAHHLFTVALERDLDRDAIRESLAGDGIETSLHYPPVHRLSAYSRTAEGVNLPQTDEYASRAITLPLHPSLSEEEVGYVADRLAAAVR